MRIAIFAAILLIALLYAAWRGGAPERTMVAIAVIIVVWDRLMVAFGTMVYHLLDIGYLALDLFGAVATFILAMTALRFWPLIAAILHAIPLLGHLSRAIDVAMSPMAYLTMQVAASWCLPPLLILATWHHQKRLKLDGSDPPWRTSLRSSPLPMGSD
ncbi:hypothetical protein [Sphingopyxis sp. JAI108]|uniref:hypothetical protein n=1 Tax=Sphingopyxis sp. JAI108 TaxID=2723060 RepID=UPI0015C7ACC4|nr:hypothetical protein [Sphingopyxis sp. JAI108]NYF32532.1 hypothetical protein [Sphingopyxis sp. JAI108]